jgi:hypothetical protein
LTHGMEQPDLRELDGKVGEEDKECALCLFPSSGNFLLRQVSFGCNKAGQSGRRTFWSLYRLK